MHSLFNNFTCHALLGLVRREFDFTHSWFDSTFEVYIPNLWLPRSPCMQNHSQRPQSHSFEHYQTQSRLMDKLELRFTLNPASQIACPSWKFRCNNGYQCIHRGHLCDGWSYCADGSDEWNCSMYNYHTFTCINKFLNFLSLQIYGAGGSRGGQEGKGAGEGVR